MSSMHFDEVLAHQAAQRLDVLADQLDGNLRERRHALTLQPAGMDEVSHHATRTVNSVSTNYDTVYGHGVNELRKLAANIRAHAKTFNSADSAGAAPFPALGEGR